MLLGGDQVKLVRLFPRFGHGRTEPSLVSDGAMPDLQKFGIRVEQEPEPKIMAMPTGAPLEASLVDVDDEVALRIVAAAAESASAPVEPPPSTGDPVLDEVLRRRSEARGRLRVLRRQLMQERRRLADITAFVRPRTAADDDPAIEEGSVEAT